MTGPPGEEPAAFFSPDGLSWQATPLARMVRNCPGYGPSGDEGVPDAAAYALATNGAGVVVVGEEVPHDATGCASLETSVRPVAWYSPNGRTWQRSAPFEVGGPNARATAVWPRPGWWQAAVEGAITGTMAIWESTDGLAWHTSNEPMAVGDTNVYSAAASDGTVVMSRWADVTSGPRLFATGDGRSWAPVDGASGCESNTTRIVPPTRPGVDAWVLLADLRLCTSRDLLTWSSTKLDYAPSRVAQTRYGALVIGDACFGAGATCAPDPRASLTPDGVTWMPIANPPAATGPVIADGPAGVLLIGSAGADQAVSVWRLDPSA